MAELSRAALTMAKRQHGVITMRQLEKAEVSRHTARRLESAGVLERDYKAVFRLASANRTLEQRCAELCLAHPKAFVSGPTAGKLLGLRKMPPRSPITLASTHPLHVEHKGVKFRRSTKVSRADLTRRSDGIVVATPLRLAFDLAGDLRDRDHRSVIDQLIHEHGVSVESLIALGSRLYHPARPGSKRFYETMLSVSASPVESDAELRVADALAELGLSIETNERWLDLPDGGRARLDLSVSDIRWGVEVDVHPSHLGVIGSTNDKRRDRQCRLIGWEVVRVTGLDLVDLDATATELKRLHDIRRADIAA